MDLDIRLAAEAEGIQIKESDRKLLRSSVKPLTEEERRTVLFKFNDTAVNYPKNELIHRVFEEQVQRAPTATALVYDGGSLTYGELNGLANAVADELINHGVCADKLVAICAERSAEFIIGMLAALKSGGAYLPVDMEYPTDRLQQMIEDADPVVLLAPSSLVRSKFDFGKPIIELKADGRRLADNRVADGLTSRNLAYVIYTSGSTGKPKGVMIEHRGVLRLVLGSTYAPISRNSCILHCASPSFDAATWEIWGALLNGARILILSESDTLDARRFADTVKRNGATTAFLTTSLLNQHANILPSCFSGLEYLLFGGEKANASTLKSILLHGAPQNLVNVYGPTETTTFASSFRVGPHLNFDNDIPIGKPIENTSIYILDDDLEPVRIGEPGEIYIGGAGVARGYLNQSTLTKDRFPEDPFSRELASRMYRTGDLGRWRIDGSIEFMGRIDRQVKIRGFRIELEEIEAHINRFAGVSGCAVMAREDTPGEKSLVAYIVADPLYLSATEQSYSTVSGETLQQWESLFDDAYDSEESGPSFSGWNSSYTGKQIDRAEMLDWLRTTVSRIGKSEGRRILEIGCGVGLLLKELAPRSELYVGTDFSGTALKKLSGWLHRRIGYEHVQLHQRRASEDQEVSERSIDLVILNSVVQYFPDIDYLASVIKRAVSFTADGGRVFVGDLRELRLLPAFHASVQLARASIDVTAEQLRTRTQRAIENEKELVVAPDFFKALAKRIPRIASVQLDLKRGRSENEVICYRYDVVLHVGEGSKNSNMKCERWGSGMGSIEKLSQILRDRRTTELWLTGIPNRRVIGAVHAWQTIENSPSGLSVGEIRKILSTKPTTGEDPEEFWSLGDTFGYDVSVHWSVDGLPEEFDARFVDRNQQSCTIAGTTDGHPGSSGSEYWREYANAPLAARMRMRLTSTLREHLSSQLPFYMIPAAILHLQQFPLTLNGKVDRRALPAPSNDAYARVDYEPPKGWIEEALADVWMDLLHVDLVGRQDSFFELGGHSLLMVQALERLRHRGLNASVRSVFQSRTLAEVAASIEGASAEQWQAPANLIPKGCNSITPNMLPLIELDPAQIKTIADAIPGGASNIQDIYPLAPLQEGMLFHYLLDENGKDVYVLTTVLSLQSKAIVERFVSGLRHVIARHDILRTAILWERLPQPVQVVCRDAELIVTEFPLAELKDPVKQLMEHAALEGLRLDLRRAPLIKLHIAQSVTHNRWYALLLLHHIAHDQVSIDIMISEVMSFVNGYEKELPLAISYRNHVFQAREHARHNDNQSYFKEKLSTVVEPTASFGLVDVLQDGSRIQEVRETLDPNLSRRIRNQARRMSVSVATIFHAACALVVAHTSGRDDVVFGTVLLGRLQGNAGAHRMLGMFINTLPIRLKTRGVTISELVYQTRQELADLLVHEQASLAEAQRSSAIAGSAPLFNTLLNYFHSDPDSDLGRIGPASGIEVLASQQLTNYPISIWIDDRDRDFILTIQTDRRVDPNRIAGYVSKAIKSLVEAADKDPASDALALPYIPEGELHEILHTYNATTAYYPKERLVHELFETQVALTPSAIVLESGGSRLTYAQINRRANQLARYLVNESVEPGQHVGICISRSPEMIIALLAILKAGAAYLPLDPTYPPERIRHMIVDSELKIVLTQRDLIPTLHGMESCAIAVDSKLKDISDYVGENISASQLGICSRNLVYVIYTSGSTGRPKGTAMTHSSMVNLIEWHRRTFEVTELQLVLQFASLSFDVAFQEIFSTLCTGGTLVLIDEWIRRDARAFTDFLISREIQRAFIPPLMLQSVAEYCTVHQHAPDSLRDVITAGEQLRITPEIRSLFKMMPGCKLHNHYGPTETHVVSTYTLSGASDGWPLLPVIGRPIDNGCLFVLDSRRQPVAIGVSGEIYIGGVCLAEGYLSNPQLTAERFVADQFGRDGVSRLYMTGDLGKWRPDGTLEYLGRNDRQVKIRGFRIELGEIQAQLERESNVKEAIVVARDDAPGEKVLVAYVVLRQGSDIDVEKLRGHLKTILPEHMIPAAFVVIDAIPQTANGKLDLRALPAPDSSAYSSRTYIVPEGDAEQNLARIWQALLRVDRVGRQDNFFELGGHSLMMVKLMERLRALGANASVREIYANPVLADMAKILSKSRIRESEIAVSRIPVGCKSIEPGMLSLVSLDRREIDLIERLIPGGAANIEDMYPLSPLQEGMLFHHLLGGDGGDTYVMPILWSVNSHENLSKFVEALQWVIDRHDILRTIVLWRQLARPLQVVVRKATLPIEELSLGSDRDAVEQLKEMMSPELQKLNLYQAPPMRLRIGKDPNRATWYVLMQLHHLVCDHESWDAMFGEVCAHALGQVDALPPTRPYRDHVSQALSNVRITEEEEFFRKKLGDVTEPTAPFGILDVYGGGHRIVQGKSTIDRSLTRRVRAQAQLLGVSSATLLHAAWAMVVASTAARDDIVFGTVLLGRLLGSAGAQRTLGMFINTLPIRLSLRDANARDLVRQVHSELVELLDYEQTSLALAQRCSSIGNSGPLFTTLFNFRHSLVDTRADLTRAVGATMLTIECWTNYPVTFSVDDVGDEFQLTADTDNRIDPQRVIGYFQTALGSLVQAIESTPQTAVLSLSVLPDSERSLILRSFNDTSAPYPEHNLVHHLFEARVELAPVSVALMYGEQQLTYQQLNACANQLSSYLRRSGVQSGDYIPLMLVQSAQIITAQLAVLKSGCVYVPLDPELPLERLAFIVRDCGARHVIGAGLPNAELCGDRVQWIDCMANAIGQEGVDNAHITVSPSTPAYVMYTSGSTGEPKGVVIPHRAVIRLVINSGYVRVEPTDCIAQCSNPTFDASTFEIWGALLNGARLLIVPRSVVLEPKKFSRLLTDRQVTILWQTAGLFLRYVDELVHLYSSLKVLMVGGDVVDPEAVRRLLRQGPPGRLLNGYGPTECTTFSTTYPVETLSDQATSIPIGRPISNTQIYILDSRLQPVPIGVTGEIHVGGDGVGVGYLSRPDITREKFITDPFSLGKSGRLFKTGDLGRWRPDGNVEFIGRNDRQVKLRGFRIELEEIESHLQAHPEVNSAAAILREDSPGEKRLVAYVSTNPLAREATPDQPEEAAGNEIVSQWKTLYEDTYAGQELNPSFVGWNSSYTGMPIPNLQMVEWLNSTVNRILQLKPRRVLEIGCGVGLLLQRIAPECEVYVGTDFSASAITGLGKWLNGRPEFEHVTLLQRTASEVAGAGAGPFDLVILNSVVQYFPDVKYLERVLTECSRVVTNGGNIFIGDVRNLKTLSIFHGAVQFAKASATVTAAQLRKRVVKATAQEKELVIDPQLFHAIRNAIPAITSVQTLLKRGRAQNELTRHRYDVILGIGEGLQGEISFDEVDWTSSVGSIATLEAILKQQSWKAVRINGVPNERISKEVALCRLLGEATDDVTITALRKMLPTDASVGVDPEALWELPQRFGYRVTVGLDLTENSRCLEVQIVRQSMSGRFKQQHAAHDLNELPLSAYANDPTEHTFRLQIVPRLKEYMKARLPEYMIPTAWVVLKSLPLTPTGKIDRRALAAPDSRSDDLGEYIAPTTDIERKLADIWSQLLRVDQVGVQDNFFELGGHSLLATRVISHIGSVLGVEVPVRTIFEKPTIRSLAAAMSGDVVDDERARISSRR